VQGPLDLQVVGEHGDHWVTGSWFSASLQQTTGTAAPIRGDGE